jgi:hypothetical protein
MKVTTSVDINKALEVVWPMLCNSTMADDKPILFRFGVPKPVECKLKTGVGGVGSDRQCISNLGTINQTITCWEPNKKLEFEMKDTDMYFGKYISSIRDKFELSDLDNQRTRITRTTEFQLNGLFGLLKSLPVWVGLKRVHKYVFENWAR